MKATRKINICLVAILALLCIAFGALTIKPVSADVVVDNADIITIERTAEARLDNTGLRYTVRVHKESFEGLTAVGGSYEGYEASLGVAVIPTVVLGGAELDATKTSYTYNETEQSVLHIDLVNKTEAVIGAGYIKMTVMILIF